MLVAILDNAENSELSWMSSGYHWAMKQMAERYSHFSVDALLQNKDERVFEMSPMEAQVLCGVFEDDDSVESVMYHNNIFLPLQEQLERLANIYNGKI